MLDLGKFSQKKICVATSGGADSMALLASLCALRETCGFILSAVHCEHGIRGEASLQDMAFVQAECQARNVPLTVFRENCIQKAKREKCGLEEAARKFRYESFASLIKSGQADYIALAHHQDDEAETVLFRLARGASLTGAKGMTEESGYLLRPLLSWSKAEILQYVHKNGISYREDSTNFERDATRNKIRLDVLPQLEAAVPGAKANLAAFADRAAKDDAFLYSLSEKLLSFGKDEDGEKEITVAFSEEESLFFRACLTAMKELGIEKDYTAAHLQSVFDLQKLPRGSKICLPKDMQAEKRVQAIVFYKKKTRLPEVSGAEQPFDESGFDGGRYRVDVYREEPQGQTEWKTLQIDADRLPEGAVFRFRREGDEIEKFGGCRKSLKKFFNEQKISVDVRSALPLIADETGSEVYVVCGVEIADRVKVTENTKNTLYIQTRKKKEQK